MAKRGIAKIKDDVDKLHEMLKDSQRLFNKIYSLSQEDEISADKACDQIGKVAIEGVKLLNKALY